MPDVVLSEPMRRKNGMQTVAITTANALNLSACVGMSVMPKTEVTKVKGRKKIETCSEIILVYGTYKRGQTGGAYKGKQLDIMPLQNCDCAQLHALSAL